MALEKKEANHQVFNVGSGVATTVAQVAYTLKELYKSDVEITISGRYRLGDIRHNYAGVDPLWIPRDSLNPRGIETVPILQRRILCVIVING